MIQKWKTDPSLYGCERTEDGKKKLDYEKIYVDEFLNADPLRDWESIDRCKALWLWGLRIAKLNNRVQEMSVLDCGAKDGQFTAWLEPMVKRSLGIEISEPYVKYCQERNRNVIYGDVCNMPEEWADRFDFVFSHHLLGLVPDYSKGLTEMFRVTKPGGYMLTCNDVPGNPKKHYSLIEDESIFQDFCMKNECEVLFNGRWNEHMEKEWVLFVRKYVQS